MASFPRFVLAALTLLGLAELASARPLTVRARTQATVDVERRPDALILRGTLRDDRDAPVASDTVHLEIPDHPTLAQTTDADGAFAFTLAPADVARLDARHGDRLPWTLRYRGGRVYGETAAQGLLDTTRAPTRISASTDPPVVALDEGEVRLHVDLAANDAPVTGAEVRVRVGDGTELLGATGPAGRATFIIRAGLLGSAGTYPIHARFLGDPLRAEASATTSLRVLLPARVTLRVGREGDLHFGRHRFSGRLADARGPLPAATVAIVAQPADLPDADPELVSLVTTQADGIFLVAVPSAELFAERHGEIDLRAIYSPDDARHQAATSHPVRVRVPPPPGVPAHWYILGLLLVVALVAGAQVVRHGALLAWWRRLRAARRPSPILPVAPAAATDEPPFVTPTAPAPPGVPRRPDHIAGRVVDAHTQRPLPGATVDVVAPDDPATSLTSARPDADGRFAVGPLAADRVVVRIGAPGYLTRELTVALPHDGALDGATFAIVAIRRRLREHYADVVSLLGDTLAWGRDTPREAYLRSRRGDDADAAALLELRRMVEAAWFSRRPATPEDVARAGALSRRFEARR